MCSVGTTKILLTILVMLSPEGLEKTYIAFSNKTFPIVDIINVCHFIYEELDLLNFYL